MSTYIAPAERLKHRVRRFLVKLKVETYDTVKDPAIDKKIESRRLEVEAIALKLGMKSTSRFIERGVMELLAEKDYEILNSPKVNGAINDAFTICK